MTARDLRRSYFPSYLSLDNILACQTGVPCRTEMRFPKFGFLVPDCNSEDLPAGVNLELPLWAARVLCRPGRTYVSVRVPPGFKEAHSQVMDEDPTSADLRKINTRYFEAGHLCTSLFHNDAGELAEMLPEMLQQRILCIGESTMANPRNSWTHQVPPTSKAIPEDKLDQLEVIVQRDAKNAATNIDKWLEPLKITTPRAHSHDHRHQRAIQQQQHQHSPQTQQPQHAPTNGNGGMSQHQQHQMDLVNRYSDNYQNYHHPPHYNSTPQFQPPNYHQPVNLNTNQITHPHPGYPSHYYHQ